MMAADSLHFAAPLIVPSGVSAHCLPCRRVQCGCIRTALRAAFGAAVQRAGVLPRTRPACGHWRVRRRAGCSCSSAAGPPMPGAERGAKAEGKTKGRGTCRPQSQSARGGGTAASPPCRVGREARADAGMSACFARSDTPELAGRSHDRPPRR
jgi:hypothetical protein